MKLRATRLAVALLSTFAATAPQAQALAVPEFLQHFGIESWWDVVQFQPWTASLGLTFTDHEQRLRGVEGATQRSSGRLFTESLTISNDGFAIVDRRLFTGSISLGLTLAQDEQQAGGRTTKQAGQLANYGFTGQFLAESPYNGDITAVRSQSTNILPSGTRTENDYRGESIALHMRDTGFLRDKEWLPYFTANLRAAQQRQRQTTTTGEQSFRQDDNRSLVTFDFQNGGETSDLAFQYQYVKLENFAYREGSYSSQSINVFHSIDFGEHLNRRLDSRINGYIRSGQGAGTDSSNLEINEFLTIDHNVHRSSSYYYLLNRQETDYAAFTTHSAGAQVSQQVYNNLSISGAANGTYAGLPQGALATAGVSGSFSYSRALPWRGTLNLNGGVGYNRSENDVPGGVVPVIDAPYAVPQSTGAGAAILLEHRDINVFTLKVVVLKGGTRVEASEGIDYTVRVEGDRTSIVPQPASAIMQPGDPLNVSYLYLVPPNARLENRSHSASFSLDWDWIGLSAGLDKKDQRPLDGTSTEQLLDERREYGSIYLFGSWDSFQAKATASLARQDGTRLAFTERRFDQYLAYTPSHDLTVSLSASQYRTDYDLPVHTVTGGAARLDLQWTRGAWITSAYLSRRIYRDTEQPDESVDEAGLRVRRTWTKLDFNLALGAQRRLRGAVSAVNSVVYVGVVRRF